MISMIVQGISLIAVGIGLFLVGQRIPNTKTVSRLIAEGRAQHRRRVLREFVEFPWICEHVRRGSQCTFAELVCGERRIPLAHLDIPHGAMVHFIEYVDGAPWNVLTPYLGGLERWLHMTVYRTEHPPDPEDTDD